MRKATLKDIREGVSLHMQNEIDVKSGFHCWGEIEKADIPRLKRQIRMGTSLWWIKNTSTKNTAARLKRFTHKEDYWCERFKVKIGHWLQRRIEYGFAVYAECVAENNRAERSKTNLRDCKLLNINIESTNLLTPENIAKEFEYKRIDEQLYHKAVYYNEMIAKEEQAKGETNDELLVCRAMLGKVFSKIPDHFKNDNTVVCRPDFLNSAIHNIDCEIKFDFPETEKESPAVPERCEHDIPKHICAVCNWVDEPILTNIPQGLSADEALDCCVGYRRQANGELIPDHLAAMDWNEHEKFHFSPSREHPKPIGDLIRNLGRAIMKELEPIIVPCCDLMLAAINEVKDAFPFFWCKRINGIVHTPWEMANRILKIDIVIPIAPPTFEQIDRGIEQACEENGLNDDFSFLLKGHVRDQKKAIEQVESIAGDIMKNLKTESHIEKTERLKILAILYGKKRFPFEPNWILTKRILKTIRG